MHLVAMAAAAGIIVNWDDFSDLSDIVPLLARIYPNGPADVNHFHAAGGMGFLIREVLCVGLLHADTTTVVGRGLAAYTQEPWLSPDGLAWRDAPTQSGDENVLRPIGNPFGADGGLKLLRGNLGRAVIKTSAVQPQHRVVEAPALVFNDQEEVMDAFRRGALERDCVVVVRFQGPRANGMPELHQLTPALTSLQSKGFRVALVTDGRMSGASGAVPAAIHLTPEALAGGPLAKLADGDIIKLDSYAGTLEAHVPADTLARRAAAEPNRARHETGVGRELFASFRAVAGDAEAGALACMPAL
jgi:phosphogluconate dehydratase